MTILIQLGLFIVGFYILVKGANILIRGATSIAKLFGISNWFIGLVIVGIGTSIPEFSINIASVFNGNNIGLATIIGSNTFNILFILGLSAIVTPIAIRRRWVLRDFTINIAAVALAALIIIFPLIGDSAYRGITGGEGILLATVFLLWLILMFRGRRSMDESAEHKILTVLTSAVMIVAGILGVFFGGKWVVDGAETMALFAGVSPTLVALTVVAVGTSLPELTVSAMAAIRRNTGIAVGNILGSNIFDFLGILGITALIRPMPVFEHVQFDILIALGAAAVLFVSMFVGKRYTLSRGKGAVFVLLYVVYLVAITFRG